MKSTFFQSRVTTRFCGKVKSPMHEMRSNNYSVCNEPCTHMRHRIPFIMRKPSSSARELAGSTSESSSSFSSGSGSDGELERLRLRGSSGSKGEARTSLPNDVSSPSIIELGSDGEGPSPSGSEVEGGNSNGRLEGPPSVTAPSSPSVIDIVSDGEGRPLDLVAKPGAENGIATEQQQKTPTAAANTSTTLLLLPAGVKVASGNDAEDDANAEVKRLLRQPR